MLNCSFKSAVISIKIKDRLIPIIIHPETDCRYLDLIYICSKNINVGVSILNNQ